MLTLLLGTFVGLVSMFLVSAIVRLIGLYLKEKPDTIQLGGAYTTIFFTVPLLVIGITLMVRAMVE